MYCYKSKMIRANGATRHRYYRSNFKNYYIENGIAYTEDHIPVQKLHLFDIPKELKKGDILEYFTQNYGQILNLEFYIQDKIYNQLAERLAKDQMKVGYALFANVQDAAKVLLKSEHKANMYEFRVQARFSWLQPEANQLTPELESQTAAILRLNDDSLEQVFEYLPLADQIHLARTCTRLSAIFQSVSARLHKSMDFNEDLSLTFWDMRDFCRLAGSSVQHLRGIDSQRLKYFPNLKSLDIRFTFDREETTEEHQIFMGLSLLEELKLSFYYFAPKKWLFLDHLKSLKKLGLYDCSVGGLSLSTSIQSLTIVECSNLDHCLPQILKMQQELKELSISKLNANMIKQMIKWPSCASLEMLKIELPTKQEEYAIIAQLPGLKKLVLLGYRIISEIFIQLAKHKSHQLEHLEIVNPNHLTPEMILEIAKLTELRSLILERSIITKERTLLEFGKLTHLECIHIYTLKGTDDTVLELISKCTKLFDLKTYPGLTESLVKRIINQERQQIINGNSHRQRPIKLYMSKYKTYSTEFSRDLLSSKEIVEIIYI